MKNFKSFLMPRWQPWLVVTISASFFFLIFVEMNIFNAINPYLIQNYHFTSAKISFLSACYFYANMLFALPAGILLDRFSVKKFLLSSLVITAAATYVFSITTSFWLMAVCRFAIGTTGAFCFLSAMKLAMRWFDESRLALVVGIVLTIGMLGGSVSQAPMTLLIDSYGWRVALWSNILLAAIFFILISIFVKDFPNDLKNKLLLKNTNFSKLSVWQSLAKVIMNRQNWLASIHICVINLPVFIYAAFGGMYLMQMHNFSRINSSYLTSMIFFGMIFGSPFIGWISDRLKSRKKPMVISSTLCLLNILAIIYLPGLSFINLLFLFTFLGVLAGAQVVGYSVIAESNTPTLTATASGIGSTLLVAGGALMPLFGWLLNLHWDHTLVNNMPIYSASDFRTAMLMLVLAAVIGLVAALFIKETHCKQI